ncbi:MAG: hypothetical protein GQE15_21335 [Archangiaceae bacterium]|nr:hypothetical protein [Archangiaceae bacterium]
MKISNLVNSVVQAGRSVLASLPPIAAQQPAPLSQRSVDSFQAASRAPVSLHGGTHETSGLGLNGSSGTLRTATGRIRAEDWSNPAAVVGRLTQNPAGGSLDNSAARCGPSSLLGAALMQGPERGARFLDSVATGSASSRLTAGERRELQSTATHLRNGTCTYEELSRAQSLLYRAGNTQSDLRRAMADVIDGHVHPGGRRTSGPVPDTMTPDQERLFELRTHLTNGTMTAAEATETQAILTRYYGEGTRVSLVDDPSHPGDDSRRMYTVTLPGREGARELSGFSDTEISGLAAAGGGAPRQVALTSGADSLSTMVRGLAPGESATVRVAGTDAGTSADHFVTVGRRADGTAFLYNSDPGSGDYTAYTGASGPTQPADFDAQLRRLSGRIHRDSDGDMPLVTVSHF